MSATITGMNELLARLDNITDPKKLEMAMGRACALVERSAKQKAPKTTGELIRSITSRIETSNGELIGIVFTPLEYAPYVEYGTGLFAENGNGRKDVPWYYQDDHGEWHSTSGMEPMPYLRPALNENRTEILRILAEGTVND